MDRTAIQSWIIRWGLPVGVVLTLIFGSIGLLLDSTVAGVVAGIAFMLMLFSLRYRFG